MNDTYQIIREIGSGGTGVIYLAYHLRLQKYVAVSYTHLDVYKRQYQNCAELFYALEHYSEMDESYKRKQSRKWAGFIASASVTLFAEMCIRDRYISE